MSGANRFVLAATLLAPGLAACGARPAPPASPAGVPRSVTTAPVLRTTSEGATVPATLRARDRAVLASRLSSSVTVLPFRVGERVGAGAVVVRLDDGAARAALAAAEVAHESARTDLGRAERLLSLGVGTPREREEAASREAAAQAALLAARETLAHAVLRAPFAATVAARPVEVGDAVSPGQPLLELEGDGGGLELHATVDAGQVGALAVGTELQALVDGRPESLSARVTALSAAADPGTHRFELRAEVPPAAGVRSGLFARLRLPAADGERRLTVPASALVRRGGLTGVFVVDGGAVRLRWIAPGRDTGDTTEVRAGLSAGERVVLGPEGLADGAAVVEAR